MLRVLFLYRESAVSIMLSHDSRKCFVILMADDDEDDRMLAQDALRESGTQATLQFVSDGIELLERLRQAAAQDDEALLPDLLLLDLNMPRLDGRAALLEIKSHPKLRKLPVVVLTTSGAPADIDACYAGGANSYITKAVTYQGLINTMRSLGHYWAETVQLPSR